MSGKFKSVSSSDTDSAHLNGRFTRQLLLAVLAAGLGSSFIFGFNIGAINCPAATIKRWIAEQKSIRPFNYSASSKYTDLEYIKGLSVADSSSVEDIWSWVVSVFPIGALAGALFIGMIADKFGRKGAMLLNNILTFAGGFTMAYSKSSGSYWTLIAGRVLIGVNCGLNSGLAPMYLTEISPVNYRGLLGSVCQLMVTISILVANILGLKSLLGNEQYWPYLLAFTMLPSVFQLATMPFCPESPRYLLITKGRHDDARNALVKLRQTNDVDAELNAIENEAEKLRNLPKSTLMGMLKNKVTLWALFIAVMMMLSQQFSGINATMFYSTQIFESDAGLSETAAMGATLAVTTVNVLMTVVSTIIVDKAGRRTLHMIGLGGMFVSTIMLVITMYLSKAGHKWAAYGSILFVILFIVAFASGPGSIPWFYVSECFEQGDRGIANSIAVATNWLATFIVGKLFPPLRAALEQASFLVFSACLALFWFFTWKWVPETKGKSVDQVIAELGRKVDKN